MGPFKCTCPKCFTQFDLNDDNCVPANDEINPDEVCITCPKCGHTEYI